MKKPNLVLTMLVLSALLLAACGGEQTATSAPGTSEATAAVEATSTSEMSTATAEGTVDGANTPGIPVTGEESPNRLSNLMDYDVWNQNGEQIGDVNDMVLDFDNTSIAYVIVGTGGFLGLGEKDVLVPWNMLQVQTDGGSTGDQNVFLFTGNEEYYRNAPDFDVNNILPEMGQPAEDWDADVESFWSTGVAPDPAAQTPEATAVATEAAVATATLAVDNQGGVTAGREMQGVVLASELLGSTIQAYGAVQGQGAATVAPDAAAVPADAATATVDATGAGTTIDPASMEAVALTVEDAIVDPGAGEIQYLVVSGGFANGERLLPVPFDQLRWDDTSQGFSLGVNTTGLENAPAFEEDQYPDFSIDGWDDEIANFWNNLESGFKVDTSTP
jgi:sporulation protein YlmC with PRC-barrel domain